MGEAPTGPPGSTAGTTGTLTFPGHAYSGEGATISRYIGVLVFTQITKNGSAVTGNKVAMAVIRVDDPAGYRPNAGHEATGTVVAVIE